MTSPTVRLFEMTGATGDELSRSRKHRYGLVGIPNAGPALGYALVNIPVYLSSEGLFRQNISQSSPGGDLYHFDVTYGPVPRGVGEWSWSSDSTGGSIHISYSKEVMDAYVPSGSTLDTDELKKSTAIGEDKLTGQIEGMEMLIPASKRSYTYTYPRGVVTEAYMDYLEAITGIVNSAPWHLRPAGEVLFLGARTQSTASADAKCSVTFEVAMSKNLTDQTFGVSGHDQITGIDKKGHHFLDVRFLDVEGGDGHPNKKIKYIKIHRVYEELDFNTYLGF